MISGHLLPLTNYLANGQYVKVQPIDSKFAERCIWRASDDKLFYRDKRPSTSANELSRLVGSTIGV